MAVKRALLLAVAAALLLAGCGDDSSGETTTTAADTTSARVYFLRDGKVWPVSREINAAEDRTTALTAELAQGSDGAGEARPEPHDRDPERPGSRRTRLLRSLSWCTRSRSFRP